MHMWKFKFHMFFDLNEIIIYKRYGNTNLNRSAKLKLIIKLGDKIIKLGAIVEMRMTLIYNQLTVDEKKQKLIIK